MGAGSADCRRSQLVGRDVTDPAGDELADAVEQWFDKRTKENENTMEDALGRYRESGG